ncbi:FAD-binding oxidoreductase [Uliginosibacterium aquaticum]|uniref:FAD-binding oxidoreductase n=1 Tax=Uliginosibacterium aquaticum TaxID=2731212 RepID=A0ABX2IDL6_9RHOO|nr:FAD-binding oxidoreductase [Uliginosibacterium aquaticum]NSL54407.1 FAD-binding oxidoreductase [Uliginosibacterium aquaticum]
MTQAFLAALRSIVGEANVLTTEPDCAAYEEDWRGRYKGRALCVVRPGCTDEVAAVVRACAAAGVPMVPQGGNTGLVGGGVPHAGGDEVLISLARLNRVRAVDVVNNTLTVEAGCTLAAVQAAAAEQGRLFPLSLASEGSCQIAGNLASNAGGVQVLRYGNTRELTLGLEVVLPDGRIWNGLRGLRKDNTGYDLKHLFIGSEGTLGIITAAVLKLFPSQSRRAVAWLALPDAGAAIHLLASLRQRAGERLTAFEIVCSAAHELVLQKMPGSVRPLAEPAPWYALVELADSDLAAELEILLETALSEAFEAGWVIDAVLAGKESQAQALWALRENISEAQKKDGISIKHDVSVPVSAIPAFLQQADAALEAAFPGVRIVAFGHAGDGNLHYNPSMPQGGEANVAFVARTTEVNRIVHDIVAALGGSISAEHGLGQLKRDEILRYKSEVEMDMMRTIKAAFDPRGLMNPGKLL